MNKCRDDKGRYIVPDRRERGCGGGEELQKRRTEDGDENGMWSGVGSGV